MKYPLILIGIIFLVLVLPFVSAYDFDNVKSFDKLIGSYGKITITNAFGLGSIISELELKNNTDICGSECSADIEIVMKEDGVLIDDVRFLKLIDKKQILSNIRSYQIYIKQEVKDIEVPDYKIVCIGTGKMILTDRMISQGTPITEETICEDKLIGYHIEKTPEWIKYNVGDVVVAGTYYVKLEGEKRPEWSYDWQIKNNGIWLNEWTVWGAEGSGNSYVRLDSPVNNYVVLSNPQTFNCTANVTGGATVLNVSLWTNQSGSLSLYSSSNKVFMNVQTNPLGVLWVNTTGGSGTAGTVSYDTTNKEIDMYAAPIQEYGYDSYSKLTYNSSVTDGILKISIRNLGATAGSTDNRGDGIFLYKGSSYIALTTYGQYFSYPYYWYIEDSKGGSKHIATSSNPPLVWLKLTILSNGSFISSWSINGDYNYTILTSTTGADTSAQKPYVYTWANNPSSGQQTLSASISNFFVQPSNFDYLNASQVSINFLDTISAPTNWTCKACDSDNVCGFSTENRTVSLDTSKPSITINNPTILTNYAKNGGTQELNWSVITSTFSSVWYNYNGTNRTVNGKVNQTNFILASPPYNLTFYANNTAGGTASKYITWDYKAFQNSVTYNLTSYETQTDNYILNISSDGSQPVTASLVYNGTSYPSTKIGDNTEMLFTNIITHPINDIGNKSFYWEITHGFDTFNTNLNYQNIINTTLIFCNGTNGMTYINFTFKDETTDLYINSTFETYGTGWQYYLGTNSSVYKTLNYNQQVNKSNYAFCLYNSNETIHSNTVSFRYDLPGYPERLHTRSDDLTNTTTNQILYLLSTADGIYSSYQVQDTNGNILKDVYVLLERQFSGLWTTIGLDETDDSGLVTFWINPSVDHRLTFIKSPYTSQTLVIRPTQSLYTVIMQGGVTSPTYYPDYIGINYKLYPLPGTLTPKTIYTFNFNITANKSNLDSYSMILYDQDNNILGSSSNAVAEGSNLTIYLNTSYYESIIGKYYIDIGNGIYQINQRTWTVLQITPGNYSIQTWFDNISMEDVDVKGKFTGYFIFFLVLFVSVAGLCKVTGADLSAPGIPLLLVLAIAWIASIGGFFNITFSPLDFINQYGIALIVTFLSGGFALGQLNKT